VSVPRAALAIAGSVTVLCVLYASFYLRVPTNADVYLALPLARASADPGLYPAGDLIVTAGLRGPFHLYRAAGWLYRIGADVDVVWHVLLLAALAALFFAVWYLAHEVSRDASVASLAVAFVACAPPLRGTLNWTSLPQYAFITATLAVPLGVVALVWSFRRRHLGALLWAAVTFLVHPYIGFIALVSTIAVLLLDDAPVPWRDRAVWIVIALAVAAPNALYIVLSTPSNFGLVPRPTAALSYAEQFQIYAYHAWVEDHWREGYGWFFLTFGAMWGFSRSLDPAAYRILRALCVVWAGLVAVYLVNAHGVRYPGLLPVFLIRVTYFLKPLTFAVVILGVRAWLLNAEPTPPSRHGLRYGAVVLLVYSTFVPSVPAAEATALLAYALIALDSTAGRLRRRTAAVLVVVALAELALVLTNRLIVPGLAAPWRDPIVGVNVVCGVALTTLIGNAGVASRPARALGSVPVNVGLAAAVLVAHALTIAAQQGSLHALAPASLAEIAQRIRVSRPDRETAPLVAWLRANTPRASLVLVDPLDARMLPLRLTAERGVYASVYEINQIAFDASVYGEAHRRLEEVGVRVLGRHQFDGEAYDHLSPSTLAALARSGVGYAIFAASRFDAAPLQRFVVYRDDRYVVVDLRTLGRQ